MRRTLVMSLLGAVSVAGLACKDQPPKLTSADRGGGAFDKAEPAKPAVAGQQAGAPGEPAPKTAMRVQRDEKQGNVAGEQQNEQQQAQQQKDQSVQTQAQTAVPQKDDDANTRTVVGRVASASDSQVEVKGGDQLDLKLVVDPSTAVRIDGRDGSAAQIAEGAEVRASYRAVDGKLTALRLDVSTAKK